MSYLSELLYLHIKSLNSLAACTAKPATTAAVPIAALSNLLSFRFVFIELTLLSTKKPSYNIKTQYTIPKSIPDNNTL